MLFPDCCLHKKNKNDTVIIQSCKHKYKGGGGGGGVFKTQKKKKGGGGGGGGG